MSPTTDNHAALLVPQAPVEARLTRVPPTYLGHSLVARRVQAQVNRAIRARFPVLVIGAEGAGKSVIARIIHHFGGSETATFHHLKAADGPLSQFEGFTYIGNLEDFSLEEQAKIPGLVQRGERLVMGTRLSPESEEGKARLHPEIIRWAGGLRVELPSLAERVEDLEVLAMYLLSQTPSRRPVGSISDDALDSLRSYAWPANVDELASVIREAVDKGATEQIELRDLPAHVRVHDVKSRTASPEDVLSLRVVERDAIKRALTYARGNKRKAARILGIGKTTLYRKLRVYGLEEE